MTTGASDEDISVEETEVEIKEEDEKKQDITPKVEKTRKEDLMLSELVDNSVKFLINQTYLRKTQDKISVEEMKATGFGKSIVKTITYYIPDWNFDHPLIHLTISSGMLLVLLNQKMPPIDDGKTKKPKTEDYEDDSGSEDNQDIPSSNPYVNIPKK